MIYIYTGCTHPKSTILAKKIDNKQLSCSQEAKPKSLQFLEQQYRCTSEK